MQFISFKLSTCTYRSFRTVIKEILKDTKYSHLKKIIKDTKIICNYFTNNLELYRRIYL